MKYTKMIGAMLMTLGLAGSASADNYVGSACSFADNPLAAHNKVHHRLVNTSGAGQWVTCPAVRRKTGSLALSFLYTATNAANGGPGITFPRVEIRNGGGTVSGWSADFTPQTHATGGYFARFFALSAGAAGANDQVVFEAFLANNAWINGYSLNEN